MSKALHYAVLSAGLFFVTGNASAQQRNCGQEVLMNAISKTYPAAEAKLRVRKEEITKEAANLQSASAGTFAKTAGNAPVPVVFHFVLTQTQYNKLGGAAGVKQRVDSQMLVMQRDFAATNPDVAKVPSWFRGSVGPAGVNFALATKAPNGSSSAGYEVKILAPGVDSVYEINANTGTAGSRFACSDVKYNGAKGLSAWDPTRYFNVWVCRVTDNNAEGVLGITTPPSFLSFNFPQGELGVVLTYGAIGKRKANSEYYFGSVIDRGRTLTHEAGHFFELEHIWGDDGGACPGGAGFQDDGVSDTPPQADAIYGCYADSQIVATCGQPKGAMWMNYMNYTDDRCMYMFTNGQAARMNSQVANSGQFSYSLTTHPELTSGSGTAGVENAAKNEFILAPNPTSSVINLNFLDTPQGLSQIEVSDAFGRRIMVQSPSSGKTSYQFDLSGLARGIYLVRCTFEDSTVVRKVVLQ
jgi:hypothetical protein